MISCALMRFRMASLPVTVKPVSSHRSLPAAAGPLSSDFFSSTIHFSPITIHFFSVLCPLTSDFCPLLSDYSLFTDHYSLLPCPLSSALRPLTSDFCPLLSDYSLFTDHYSPFSPTPQLPAPCSTLYAIHFFTLRAVGSIRAGGQSLFTLFLTSDLAPYGPRRSSKSNPANRENP